MKPISKKYIKEILLLVFALISVSMFWYYQYNIRQENYFRQVRKNISSAITEINQQSKQLQEIFRKNDSVSLTIFLKNTKYPAYIFQNKKLIFWSDFRIIPDYEQIEGNYQYKVLNLKNGKFITHKVSILKESCSTEIYILLPVYYNFEIDNPYLISGLNTNIIPEKYSVSLSNDASKPSYNIYSPDDTFLFSLNTTGSLPSQSIDLSTVIIFCLLLYGYIWTNRFNQKLKKRNYYEWGALNLCIYLAALRYFMIEYNLGYYLTDWNIFDSKYYASSQFSPSLGDLTLNIICLLIVAMYLMKYFLLSNTYSNILKLRRPYRFIISVILIIAIHGCVVIPFELIKGIYLHSQAPLNTLDITKDLNFNTLRIVCLVCFILCSILYFLLVHTCSYVFCRLYSDLRQLLGLLIGISISVAIILFTKDAIESDYTLLSISFIHSSIIIIFNLPGSLYRFRYVTSIYLFTCALACAGIGSHAIYHMEQEKKNIEMVKHGWQWLAENDKEGEFLLNQTLNDIENDYFIKVKLTGVLTSIEAIQKKIKRFHLNPYFDKYDVNILIFNNKGEPYLHNNREKLSYLDYVKKYRPDKYKTVYEDIYFNPSYSREDVVKEYISFSHIDKDYSTVGYIILDLKQKKINSTNVYPELLIDKSMINASSHLGYSYAIFQDKKLLYNSGNYNYKQYFNISWFKHKEISDYGITENGFHHLLVKGKNFETDRKQILVSSERYPIRFIFSNLSFLFLLLVLVSSFIIFYYSIKQQSSHENSSFSNKIQIYLNLAFFLPLFVVSIVILSRVALISKENLKKNFVTKALNIGNNIAPNLDVFKYEKLHLDTLITQVSRLAKYSGSDINVFNKNGKLIASSQPRIYEKSILSDYINPFALKEITEDGNKEVLLEESVGNLKYNSVYIGIKDNNKNDWLGIISIPFFTSQSESDQQVMELLTSILNIFTTVFIVFLLLSYFASRILTVPLQLIAQKLTKTSLNEYNEPLQWKSDDEIGLLVGEYNKMLINLEESKKALSISEKETAWREMAQQVAHEIKNPLTPMKLTLQHLQRILLSNQSLAIPNNSINTLLEQIDTLNDIASSFSAFAKMPSPKEEVIDIVSVLNQTIDLYLNNEEINIETNINADQCLVKSDDHLLNRIFTNIILNGIQSVSSNRKPVLKISLFLNDNKVIIEIKDNGKGIPQNIQDKVFIPNFSTKYAGSGIGLALAKRGIEHATGKIWFVTEENVGTSFFIMLPVYKS